MEDKKRQLLDGVDMIDNGKKPSIPIPEECNITKEQLQAVEKAIGMSIPNITNNGGLFIINTGTVIIGCDVSFVRKFDEAMKDYVNTFKKK